MRRGIYYWKCDCPRPEHERTTGFTAAKYDGAGIEAEVHEACRAVLGSPPENVAPLRCAGDHYAYRVEHSGRPLLFRAAADATGDDYMLAEAALTALAGQAGVPVPRILHTAAEPGARLRWQLMEFVAGSTLRDVQLDGTAVASDLGRLLRRLHRVPIDGFGFIDTDHLRATGQVRGLDRRYADYITCRLDDHLAYVTRHGLLGADQAAQARGLFTRHAQHFELEAAVLVHRDPALWNLIGDPRRITALIDWDDAVGGDPADDLSILRCLHDAAYTAVVETAYWDGATPPDGFEARVRLHTLRNMLWKAQIRHQLGYFKPGAAAFLVGLDHGRSLEQTTRAKLREALTLCLEIV